MANNTQYVGTVDNQNRKLVKYDLGGTCIEVSKQLKCNRILLLVYIASISEARFQTLISGRRLWQKPLRTWMKGMKLISIT